MKIFRLQIVSLLLGAALASCSKDTGPADNTQVNPAVGSWKLVELNINPPQDIDGDGNTTTNILSELSCVSGTLIIKEDQTWSSVFTGVNITTLTNGQYFISCTDASQTNSGTWQLQNNQVTLFRGTTSTFFMLNGIRLTNSVGEDLPGFRSEIYEKQ